MKHAGWLLTLLIALVYTGFAGLCPAGVIAFEHPCVEPSVCEPAGHAHVESFLTHGHFGELPCEDESGCQAQLTADQIVVSPTQPARPVPFVIAVLQLCAWHEPGLPAQPQRRAACAWGQTGLVCVQTTHLLI